MSKEIMAAEYARKCFSYDAETGAVTWRRRDDRSATWNTRYAGRQVGTLNSGGYYHTSVDGIDYSVHRLAWLVEHGEWPEHQLDHINGDRSDNRLSNLRKVTPAENNRNIRRARNNTSGFTGVVYRKAERKWCAQIKLGGKNKHLGLFADIQGAISARKEAEKHHGFHQNHGSEVEDY
jgi:hypothetical protein